MKGGWIKAGPRKVLEVLHQASPAPVTIHQLVDALYADRPDGGPTSAEAIVAKYIRRLRTLGHDIRTGKRGTGYSLQPIEGHA